MGEFNRNLASRLFLVMGAVVLGTVLVGCDQGGSSQGDLSAEEASNRITSSIENLSGSIRTLEGGNFSTRLKDFLGLQNGEVGSEDWAEQLVGGLESVFQTTDARFDFDGSTGKYAWDDDQKQWTNTGSSDNVILKFPADKGASSNNATFTLDSYSDTELVVDGEPIYLPKSGSASLSVEGSDVFSLSLSGVSYETEEGLEVPVPQSFSLEIFTAPHTHSFDLTKNSNTDFSFSFDLKNGDQLVTGLSADVILATDNYDEIEGSDVQEISGEVKIGPDLVVPYTAQVGELASLDDPSEQQINDRIDARVKYKGQKIATLRYDKAEEKVEVVYTDGSVDPASAFYESFIEEMESIWSDYTGGGEIDVDLDARNLGAVGASGPDR